MTVLGFDSWEEMREHMARQEKAAAAALSPEQLAIQPGAYVEQRVDPERYGNLRIVGRTFTEDEMVARERYFAEKAKEPFDEDYERRKFREQLGRHYLYGWWSSAIEPGEYGSVHRYNMLREISQATYLDLIVKWRAHTVPVVGATVIGRD